MFSCGWHSQVDLPNYFSVTLLALASSHKEYRKYITTTNSINKNNTEAQKTCSYIQRYQCQSLCISGIPWTMTILSVDAMHISLFSVPLIDATFLSSYCTSHELCPRFAFCGPYHHNDVIMSAMASQINSLTIVYTSVCLRADQRKHQSSASLAFPRTKG